MSAIGGLLHTDGRTADHAALQRMLEAMAHRSPDGSMAWHEGPVALGHGELKALPEARSESLPLTEGDLTITADVRLDNRDELIAALALGPRPISDAALVLAAYRKWGEDCPARLLGDFAVAMWDGGRNRLFCARDHMGVKPFYYHSGAGVFAFASEIKALFAFDGISVSLNEARIADYLAGMVTDVQSTLYADVFRLPPHHSLTVAASGLELRSYWQLAPSIPTPGDDLVERFRDLFANAVRCRLVGPGRVGAMLSGGLDSSSIATVAAPLVSDMSGHPLATISAVFDRTPAWNERPFIEAVLATCVFDPSFIESDDVAPFADLDRILVEQEGAFLAPGLAISRQLYSAAAKRGIRVLLDGHGGDEVVSHGYGRLHELARAHRWFALWRESSGVSRTYGDSAWHVFRAYLSLYGPLRRLPFLRAASRVRRRLAGHGNGRLASTEWINADLVARTDLAARYRAQRRSEAEATVSEQTRQEWFLSSGMVPHAFEVLDRAAAAAGVEPRYPFWDKRLVEFCLGLPSEAKLKDGWSRLILRRAMEDILPRAVQWRRDKLDFAPHLIRGMLAHHSHLLDEILVEDSHGVGRFVDLGAVAAAHRRVVDQQTAADGNDVQIVWRTVVLAFWLRQMSPTRTTAVAA